MSQTGKHTSRQTNIQTDRSRQIGSDRNASITKAEFALKRVWIHSVFMSETVFHV